MPAYNYLRILTYHRIAERESIGPYDPMLVSATPAEFEKQMSWLARHYSVVDVADIFNALDRGVKLPRRAVLITFDDAYPDFKTTAWPILKSLSLAATLFVPTDYASRPETPFWWDKLTASLTLTSQEMVTVDPVGELPLRTDEDIRAANRILRAQFKLFPHADALAWLDDICKRLLPEGVELRSTMSWEDIKTLADDGVTMGAHSKSHPLLTHIPVECLRDEIAGSYGALRNVLPDALPIFCYPGGGQNATVEKVTAESGIRLGFATRTGHNRLDRCNLLQLRRVNITPRTDLNILRIKLSAIGIGANIVRKKLFS